MTNPYFTKTGGPGTRAVLSSAQIRAEFALIEAGFDKHPTLSGNALKLVRVNAGATALEAVATIDAIVIGGTTPAAGTFTTLASTGNTTIGNASGDTLTVHPNAVTWQNNPTHSGNHIFSGNVTVNGDTVVGNAAGDTLTIAPSAVTWSNNPTHSGNHTFSGLVLASDGTAAAPSIAFSEDTDTGVFRTGVNGIGLSTGGSSRLQATSTAVASLVTHQFTVGSAAAPSVTFSTDTDTGLFSSAANVLGFAVAGGEHATLTTVSLTKIASSAGLTSPNSNYDDLTVSSNNNSGLSIISGTAAIGGIMFQDSTDGQLAGRLQYSHSLDTLALYAGNSLGLTIGAATLDTSNAITSSSTARFNGGAYGFLGIREGGAYGGAGPNSNSDGIALESNGNTGISILTPNTAVGRIAFGDPESNVVGRLDYNHATESLNAVAGGSSGWILTATAFTLQSGTEAILADVTPTTDMSAGFRDMPTIGNTATATKAAIGKCYLNTGAITINNSVFAAGDAFCVYNNSASNITITDGTITTMRLGGTATTGSRTLAPRGMAHLFFPTATECVVSGAGVS